jgi:hypothetical protein
MASMTWNSHREYTEVEIAPMLNPDLSVETSGVAQITGPVGSTAVRTAIEDVPRGWSLRWAAANYCDSRRSPVGRMNQKEQSTASAKPEPSN